MPDTKSGYYSMKRLFIIFVFVNSVFILRSQVPMIPFGMGSQMFSPSYPTYGGGTGNLDYLLDPNFAIMQVQQRMAQEQALQQQLINISVQQVAEQEQKEFQQARQFRPNLTIEQFRQEKAQAYQMTKESERDESHSRIVSVKCSNCGGEGWTHKNLYMGNGKFVDHKSRCSYCHGTGTVNERQ